MKTTTAAMKARKTALLTTRSTDQLKEIVGLLMNDSRDGGTDVLDWVLVELETRMPEAEFVAFCDSVN